MVISNIHNDYDIELSYDENILKIVENHKHLGVTISSNNKWSNHIDSIINSASKQISYLRKLIKGKRKVQGVPQSQTAALPRPQEEEKTDKSKQAQIEQTYEKH